MMRKQMRRATWVRSLVVPLLWATVLGVPSRAQASPGDVVGGRLTLPFAARWGEALLPAGEYSFALDSLGRPRLLLIRGDGDALIVPEVASADSREGTVLDESALIAVRHHGRYTVRALRLFAEGLQLILSFPTPKGQPERAPRTPALLQRVPIQVLER
jgi:hypothetical protein